MESEVKENKTKCSVKLTDKIGDSRMSSLTLMWTPTAISEQNSCSYK